jgi:hypothetical protein
MSNATDTILRLERLIPTRSSLRAVDRAGSVGEMVGAGGL